jgi:hypothetical protein
MSPEKLTIVADTEQEKGLQKLLKEDAQHFFTHPGFDGTNSIYEIRGRHLELRWELGAPLIEATCDKNLARELRKTLSIPKPRK